MAAAPIDPTPSPPTLTVVAGGTLGDVYALHACKTVLGTQGADLVFEAAGLCDRHAKLVIAADGTVMVFDLGSEGGTRINGVLVEVATLSPGDTLQLGERLQLRLDPCVNGETRLSPRQQEVALLVAKGCSNREIARTLFISERTVSRHLENVYLQLGLHNRASLTRWILAGC